MANQIMPDFAAISADHSAIATAQERLATQMGLVGNLPAVDQGNRMVTALNEIKRDLLALRTTTENLSTTTQNLSTTTQNLSTSMDNLRTTVSVNESNFAARLYNSSITRPEIHLQPVKTAGGVVPANFPATPAALSSLSGHSVGSLLLDFGLPVVGSLSDKKQQLRIHVGLAHMA